MLHTTEEELIIGLKEGRDNAYQELLNLFGSKIYNTAIGMLQNTEDAEDLTQDVFAEIFQSIKKFKGESKLSTWIYRITLTKSLEQIRSKKRKKRFGIIVNLFADKVIENNKELTCFDHPGKQLENKERATILLTAINQLPENQKTSFILHKIEQLSYSEIADVMQVSLSSVESLMFRAKQNLQKILEEYYVNNR